MSFEFVLASGNSHKAKELGELFDSSIISISPAPEQVEVEETGSSFSQNAALKAHAYWGQLGRPTISDDSGLVVEALPGELGVTSARFGGEGLSDRARAELLLEKMAGKKGVDRSAHFVCVLSFYFSPDEVFFFEGRMDGEIATDYRGEYGFGYDPVFIPTHHQGDQTLAELPDWKKEHSHRAQAAALAQRFFRERL